MGIGHLEVKWIIQGNITDLPSALSRIRLTQEIRTMNPAHVATYTRMAIYDVRFAHAFRARLDLDN